jgi:hypothetical protein
MPQLTIEDIAAALVVVDPSLEYYAVTLTVDEGGTCVVDTQTHWVGWAEIERLTELRVPSIVNPDGMIRYWKVADQPFVCVKNESEWFVYIQIGGNALVERQIAETHLPETFMDVQSDPSIRIAGDDSPFVSLKTLPKHAIQRAPSPKLRMEVLNRDNRRCRICGSSPANNVHVELHVHHIRPWERGGFTHIGNLITLCHTCHKGLNPHEDHSLFDLLSPLKFGGDHTAGVHRYRARLMGKLGEFKERRTRIKKRATHQRKER